MDAKATVQVGPCARGGKSRTLVAAVEHDLQPTATLPPVGILLPAFNERFGYGVTSKGPSDGLADRLGQWWEAVRARLPPLTTLVLHVDNGPENHRRRTQGMPRMVECVQQYQVTMRLAYDPPYHSKYNPLERCWGILDNHWHGSLLDAIDTVLQFAATLTWKGMHPIVALGTTTYQTGVTLTKEAMEAVEATSKRLPHVEQWFVDIVPTPVPLWDS
jgi:DDE family transposase